MKVEIIEGKRHHCGQIARSLRAKHAKVLADRGIPVHQEIVDRFNDSAWVKAMLIDGRLVALGGVTGTLASGEGLVWLALSAESEKYPTAIAREGIRQMRDLMQTRSKIVTLISTADAPSVQFSYFLGFAVQDRTEVLGVDVLVMAVTERAKRVA